MNNTNMLRYNKVKNIFLKLSELIIHKTQLDVNPLCSLEEINISHKTISITCKGVRSPIKLKFCEIINDFVILANLSSKHASWVGYYYGKYYNDFATKNIHYHDSINFNFSSNHSDENFNIVMLNRNSELIYADKTNTTHVILPIKALSNAQLIKKFSPIQAFYIGILAGTDRSNRSERKLKTDTIFTHLKLVK